MNILYVSSKKRWGGVVSWMRRTASGLGKMGHNVWILSHPRSRFTQSAPNDLDIVVRRLGPDYNPFMIFYLCRFMKRHKIDVVVTNIEKEVIAGGIAARLAGIPNVRRVGNEVDFIDGWRERAHHRLLVDHCIVPCNLVRDRAMRRASWLRENEFTTIYNGRNIREFSDEQLLSRRRQWGLSGDDGVIGITCQLKKVKAVSHLIRAFDSVSVKHPEWYLVVSGEGPERRALEALAGELEIYDRVVFAGFCTDPMLSAAAYDIAVSTSGSEGFPNILVEYLASGAAVVSTDVGGVREVLEDGKNGLLINYGDIGDLSEKLFWLVENPNARLALSRKAKETIGKGFSEDRMLESLEKFFRRVIRVN